MATLTDVDVTVIRNPASGEEIARVPRHGADDAAEAVARAAEAFPTWWETPASKRGELLHEAAQAVLAARDELSLQLTLEQGKPLREARIEITRFVHTLEHYAGLAKNLRGGYVPNLDVRTHGLVLKRPLGVVVAIVPWNFPTTLLGNKLGPALVCGNVVVAKPAETTPLTTLRIAELMREHGSRRTSSRSPRARARCSARLSSRTRASRRSHSRARRRSGSTLPSWQREESSA